jgi:O-antigen/teichoic acid export membrane protein
VTGSVSGVDERHALLFTEIPSLDVVGQRVARGAVLSVLRFGFPFALGIAASIILTKILVPAQFGVYAIFATLAPMMAVLVGSVATAFVTAREFTAKDINAFFWTMEVTSILIGGTIVAAGLAGVASVTSSRLLVTLGLFMPLVPLRFPADISFNRQVRMDKLAVVEACEISVYQGIAVGCAFAGLGSLSFGVALVAGAFTAAVVNFLMARWLPQRPAFAGSARWLKVSLPYMLTSGLAYAKDRPAFILLAAAAGTTVLGYFSWAFNAAIVLSTLSWLAAQGLFGLFVQIRDDREAVGRIVSLVLRLLAVGVFGFSACLASCVRPLISNVFSPLWLPATHSFWLLLIATSSWALVAPLQYLAIADRRVSAVNRWLLVQIGVIWIAGAPAAIYLGPGGFALCFVVANVSFLALAYRSTALRYPVAIFLDVGSLAVAAIAAAVAGFIVANYLGQSWLSLFSSAGTSLLAYSSLILVWRRRQLLTDAHTVFELLRH